MTYTCEQIRQIAETARERLDGRDLLASHAWKSLPPEYKCIFSTAVIACRDRPYDVVEHLLAFAGVTDKVLVDAFISEVTGMTTLVE